jgi:hypothetical protein
MDETTSGRAFLRHALATLAYRGGKALRGAPAEFAEFRAGITSRTPAEILAHMGDLMDWGLSIAEGKQKWSDSPTAAWDELVVRFHQSLQAFDSFLASDQPLEAQPEKLLQGPVADAIWHAGQLALLRRLAGAPIKGENYYKADITTGRVGPDQATPRREFD